MTAFCPSPWPEEQVPCNEQDCQDCGLYEHGSRMIWGEGNPEAPIMVVLDNPGAREDRDGNPFVCGTRQTLQQTVNEVGLTMDDLYVTFILKRKPVRAYEKDETRSICMQHLDRQLQQKQPEMIICLGNVAVQSFFQDKNMDVKSSRGKVFDVHGYKTQTAYHPLAVRRRPNLWRLFLEDWQQLSQEFHK